jgi:hypothetical protein
MASTASARCAIAAVFHRFRHAAARSFSASSRYSAAVASDPCADSAASAHGCSLESRRAEWSNQARVFQHRCDRARHVSARNARLRCNCTAGNRTPRCRSACPRLSLRCSGLIWVEPRRSVRPVSESGHRLELRIVLALFCAQTASPTEIQHYAAVGRTDVGWLQIAVEMPLPCAAQCPAT